MIIFLGLNLKKYKKISYINHNITNTNIMIYFVCILVGLLNGMFASGAGQILVFYLIFIKKNETHMSRALSVSILSISSIFAMFSHIKAINFEIKKTIIFIITAFISGKIGSKLMKKIPSNILNLLSGIIISGLTIYKFCCGEK